MTTSIQTDICVIGGGSGGLSVAAGAVQMGAETVLVERGKMGGDCLNYGCVPSKSLLAAAKEAHHFRHSPILGVSNDQFQPDFSTVRAHIRAVIERIEPHDSVERFEGLGVKVIKGSARFTAPDQVSVNEFMISAKKFVIATGSSAVAPPVPGLDQVKYLTNENIFDNDELPEHLLIIGGGPIGCEMAQAHRRLGSAVTILDIGPILSKDDPDMVAVVRGRLQREGVRILDHITIDRIEAGPRIHTIVDGKEEVINGSHLLIAAGRKANLDGLGLDKAGIETTRHGVKVDTRLRSTNKNVFAIGDAAGGLQFTHVAGYHAGIVIRNALFKIPAKISYDAVPWVTYTSPELAHVGMTENDAKSRQLEYEVLTSDFNQNDRAVAEADTEGGIKAIVARNGRILGATIVGAHAGDLILPWTLAIANKNKISTVAGIIAPYPTRSEVSKRAAGSYYTPRLFSDRTKRIVRMLLKLPF